MKNQFVKDAVAVIAMLLVATVLFTSVSPNVQWILAAERFFMQTSGVITYVGYLLYRGR